MVDTHLQQDGFDDGDLVDIGAEDEVLDWEQDLSKTKKKLNHYNHRYLRTQIGKEVNNFKKTEVDIYNLTEHEQPLPLMYNVTLYLIHKLQRT
jgi:hypothetical protein